MGPGNSSQLLKILSNVMKIMMETRVESNTPAPLHLKYDLVQCTPLQFIILMIMYSHSYFALRNGSLVIRNKISARDDCNNS